MRMTTALGLMTFLAACPKPIDDAVGLRSLEKPLGTLGREVSRIDDPALTSAFRGVAARWEAAIGA